MAYSPIHPLLAHLSETQITELIRRYYDRERIKDLLSFYKIDCLPSRLFSFLPLEVCNDPCPNCGNTMVVPRISRKWHRTEETTGTTCTHCSHRTGQQCSCDYCQQQKTSTITKRSAWTTAQSCVQMDKLSLQQVVSVLALAKSFGSFEFDRAFALKASVMPFAPAGYYGDRLIAVLMNAELVKAVTNPHQAVVTAFLSNSGLPNPYMIIPWCAVLTGKDCWKSNQVVELMAKAAEELRQIDECYVISDLQDEPDADKIEKCAIAIRKAWYVERETKDR